MREPVEEPEIQAFKNSKAPAERRHSEGRLSNAQQHRRKELPVYEDIFTRRLGSHSTNSNDGRTMERSSPFFTTSISNRSRRNYLIDETARPSRNHEVVKVDKKGCRWPCNPDGAPALPRESEIQKTPRASSSSRQPASTRSANGKESKGLGDLLSRKIFRQDKSPVFYPAWEAEWALFRQRHELEMKQMKEMYMGLQDICQELKRMSSQKEDVSGASSRRVSVSESCDSRVGGAPLQGQTRKPGGMNVAHGSIGHHQPNRRAKSTPKSRVNWDTGLTKENSMHIRVPYNTTWCCPTAAIFEEIIQVERVYLRNFVATLVKYGEERLLAEEFESERKNESLSDLVTRLVPHATFAKPWHFKYALEAWLNRVVFKDFGKASFGSQEGKVQDARAKRISSWDEYQRLSLLSPVDAIDPEGQFYYRSFHVFCNRKFQAVHDELQWGDEWPDNLVEDFLDMMKHVWRAHKLALAFDPPASLFSIKSSAAFDIKFMEPLQASQNDDLLLFPSQVGFIVNPGFIVLDRIIKGQVYLSPKASLESP